MIKTMLLTAQLALSPIVATNGLQPKRLPNPVYGETTSYDVTYEGKTYRRYLTDYASTEIDTSKDFVYTWGTDYDNPQRPTIYPQATDEYGYSNIKVYNDWGNAFEWEQDPETGYTTLTNYLLAEKTAYSFWAIDEENGTTIWYFELFVEERANTHEEIEGVTHFFWYNFKDNGEGKWTLYDADESNLPNYRIKSIFRWGFGLTNPWQSEYEVDWGHDFHYLPSELNKVPNPSIYDNIYNFYYQNLFANDALDELSAEVGNNSMTMRQWLAHTATIVSISLLACALVILIIKIFKLIAGSISDIWG